MIWSKLKAGLARTREQLAGRIRAVVQGAALDESLYEDLEAVLITADVGVATTQRLLERLRERVRAEGVRDAEAVPQLLAEEMRAVLEAVAAPPATPAGRDEPLVVLVVGVNGSGKTTTTGKLASRYRKEGWRVVVGAADTFRAAAIDQLERWCQRSGAELVRQHPGADPAAVAFDALQAARARGANVLLVDTAGRLHTRVNLMEELRKTVRVLQRLDPTAPHEVLLVLDATTGQNALAQARHFTDAVGVTGIVLTKLDGTARGGMVVAIADQLGLPVKWVGTGEGADDLAPFDPAEFVRALFDGGPAGGGA
ncbi:signal recognition particle-docking protein FtsY [Thermaerobacter marianensis DSM 12885]|uniref:Signal recognition particle receptor FtsY n=1 Tax=Thermaerobacter marianensis (strain ATCC 700841 / DSM 12885 / JCM 10246 / 7p75a) TaxID=644966 RepID=E6SJE0_THEM7|nr:signal recognition particle-docking protein FtsY [Thermaerobacter marianensis]ADU51068.1 signal recognition particle-docking protein FtsY [Thermaerobacter marianensis DSM 12885]